MHASLKWIKNMQFECDNNGNKVIIDATKEHGGDNSAPGPKDLLLNAMMGCTAIDTRSLLNKMRQNIHSMEMEIEAIKTKEYPIHFESALIKFHFQGEGEIEKVVKAVTKSLTQYCGVNFIVSKTCKISFEIYLNEQKIHSASAKFQD